MPIINNVAPLLNYVNQQAGGIYGPEVTDLDSFVSLGDTVLSSETMTESFTKTLCDVIYKTIELVRTYKSNNIKMISHADEYGAVLRTIDVDLMTAVKNPAYDLTDGSGVDQDAVSMPTVHQDLFSSFDAWQFEITIPDVQWKTAFHSLEEMQALIDAIFTQLANSKARYLENAGRAAYANLIGENVIKTKEGGCATVINLLAAYNSQFGKNLTTNNCIYDPEFDRYCTYIINDTVKTMQTMTTLYNVYRKDKWTPKENLRVMMSSQFASACKMYLQSDVFYKDLVELPMYTEIPYWQSVGNGERNFADASTINIRTASGQGVYQHGIIAALVDDEAAAVIRMDERTKSHYNANGEYTNYFAKSDMGYINNMRMQAVFFVVADIATPTESSLSKYFGTVVHGAEEALTTTITLKNSETVSALKVNGVTLTSGTDYTVSTNTYTFPTTYLDDLTLGDTIVEFTLSTGAIIPYTIHVVPAAS